MNAAQIIRAAIPDADDATVEHVIWGRSPWPFVRPAAQHLYKAASGFKRATDKGIRLCDHCEAPAAANDWECRKCYDARHAFDNQR